jgi:hypothetical protein
MRNAFMELVGKYEVKRQFLRHRIRWKDNIKMNSKKYDGKA